MNLLIRPVSSLEKVFPVPELDAPEFVSGKALRGEVFSFQIAFKLEESDSQPNRMFSVSVSGKLEKYIQIRNVKAMPSEYPANTPDDHDILNGAKPGLYPDLLNPLIHGKYFYALKSGWCALWVTVRVPESHPSGVFEIPLKIESIGGNPPAPDGLIGKECLFRLEILPEILPEQELKRIEWFHADCIYKKYKVECWSEAYWKLLEKYIRNAADHGINVMFTPLWTPPLDTAVGTERPTVQLLEVEKSGENFLFRFDRLERFLTLAKKCGMKYFEMSHAFTQWGATATPKIIVRVNGRDEKYFGWHVPADSPEYASFLRQLMGELLPLLRSLGLSGKCYFPVSDEPGTDHIESYGYASNLLKSVIGEFETLDALSSFEFFQRGLVENPIPCTAHIEDFRGHVKELWTYYCCGGYQVSNRFFAMTSARTRVIGILFYLYDVKGFLQWGYNFWYSQYSLDTEIDVFGTTDAGRAFPSGDAFLVYPGPEGPLDSLRNEVFREGLQDLRLLKLAERKIGRQAVLDMIRSGIDYDITMMRYPCSSEWLLGLRERVQAVL